MKFIDHNSPEKAIINNTFNSLSYMDMWISSIVEGYIYEKVNKPRERKGIEMSMLRYGNREEYMLRYGKKEGEYKVWWNNGQLWFQEYYKEGKEEGECKWWHYEGQLRIQCYYKEGKKEGECKEWYRNGQLCYQCSYKEGKLEGEYKQWYRGADGQSENGQLKYQEYYKEGKREGEWKKWDEDGNLTKHRIYTGGEVIQDLLSLE